jgi:hypothetical protein
MHLAFGTNAALCETQSDSNVCETPTPILVSLLSRHGTTAESAFLSRIDLPCIARTATAAQFHHYTFCPTRTRIVTMPHCSIPCCQHCSILELPSGEYCANPHFQYTQPRRTVRHHFQINEPQSRLPSNDAFTLLPPVNIQQARAA